MGWVDTRGGRDRGGARPERGWPHTAAREEDTRGAKQKNEACPPPPAPSFPCSALPPFSSHEPLHNRPHRHPEPLARHRRARRVKRVGRRLPVRGRQAGRGRPQRVVRRLGVGRDQDHFDASRPGRPVDDAIVGRVQDAQVAGVRVGGGRPGARGGDCGGRVGVRRRASEGSGAWLRAAHALPLSLSFPTHVSPPPHPGRSGRRSGSGGRPRRPGRRWRRRRGRMSPGRGGCSEKNEDWGRWSGERVSEQQERERGARRGGRPASPATTPGVRGACSACHRRIGPAGAGRWQCAAGGRARARPLLFHFPRIHSPGARRRPRTRRACCRARWGRGGGRGWMGIRSTPAARV